MEINIENDLNNRINGAVIIIFCDLDNVVEIIEKDIILKPNIHVEYFVPYVS